MKKGAFFIILICFLQTGCSRNSSQILNDIFVKDTVLCSDIIKIKELLVPVHAILLDSFIVFLNDPLNSENLFFVYSYDNWEFCYSFGEIGQGPDDFIAPTLVYNSKGNNLYVYDQYGKKLIHYEVGKEKSKEVSRVEIMRNDFVLQNISFLNDSILLYNVLTNRDVNLYSYNINTNINVDTLFFDTSLNEALGSEYNPSLDYFNFTHTDDKILIGFEFFNELRLIDVSIDGNFSIDNNTISGGYSIEKSLYDNLYYYLFPTSTRKYVFLQYYGKEFKNLQPFPLNLGGRDFHFYVEVYDWNKNPVVRFTLDKEFLRLLVDERRGKIYTWNYLENFENVYSYDVSWIGL